MNGRRPRRWLRRAGECVLASMMLALAGCVALRPVTDDVSAIGSGARLWAEDTFEPSEKGY